MIGHSEVLSCNIWKPGWKFHLNNKETLLKSKKEKEELVRKTEVKLDKKLVGWGEIKTLFDVDINFHKKVGLGKKIDIGKEEREKIQKIHDIRIKYFHPFKLPILDPNTLKEEAEKSRKLTRELLKDLYRVDF